MFEQYDDLLTVDDVMEALNIGRSKISNFQKEQAPTIFVGA